MKKNPHAVVAVAFLIAAASANAQNANFMELVKAGSPQDIKKALGGGLDVNSRDEVNGWTPLMYAARFNRNPESLVALLDSGAKIEARADDGSTVLMCAAAGNTNPEVISALVKRGAQVDARAGGWTALMCGAGFNDNPEVVLALLKAGANAKLRDNTGKTAFDRARLNDRMRGTEAYAALKRAVSD